jgi:hypothetical protein
MQPWGSARNWKAQTGERKQKNANWKAQTGERKLESADRKQECTNGRCQLKAGDWRLKIQLLDWRLEIQLRRSAAGGRQLK